MGRKYYALVASLPRMPELSRAERLPISPLRLRKRQAMLSEDDRGQLQTMASLLRIHQEPLGMTDAQVAGAYREARRKITSPALRSFLDYRTCQMTLLAALRRRARELPPPDVGEYRDLATPIRQIVARWDQGAFGLQYVYPWITRAAELMQSGQARPLQEFLWRMLWQQLTALQRQDPFGVGEVFAIVLKWHILKVWLEQNSEVAAEKFRALLSQVTHDTTEQLA